MGVSVDMKIFFMITGLGVGGAERQVLDLADRLNDLGHTIKICYMTGPVLLRPKSNDIELIGLNLQKSLSGLVRSIFELKSIIRTFDPDVVHAHMVHANLFSRLMRLVCPMKKLVNTAHSTNEGGKARMLAYRWTHSLADVNTNVTARAVQVYEEKKAIPVGGMIAVSNGIDTDIFKIDNDARSKIREFHGVSEHEKVILAVGRLAPAKDYENLITSFHLLSSKIADTKLWIIGEGNERQKLIELVHSLGISSKVVFLGVRSDVASFYNAADLYVLSSAWEGFGLVVAEAMASEKVVVATDCGGVSEVVGECGYLVTPKNAQALMAAMDKALRLTADEAAFLGRTARYRVLENYSIDKIVKVWEGIYFS